MQDLRLIGVHEDGQRLLLAGPDGAHFTVPLDEALRGAARRERPGAGQLPIETDGGMRPRDVQSMIRSGASAEEVADRSGWSVEKIRKYEGPILAERVHVADQARQVRMRSRGQSGSVTPTLQGRVGQRMRERGVDPDTSTWDAWRGAEDRHWTVVLSFAAGGRQRHAAWSYDVMLRSVEASDDEARWLSADEPAVAGPLPSAAPRETRVYDVEAEGGVDDSVEGRVEVVGQSGAPSSRSEQPLDLMTAMRQRTTVGRRSGRRRPGTPDARRVEVPAPALPIEDVAPELLGQQGEDVPPPRSPREDVEEETTLEPPGAETPPLEEDEHAADLGASGSQPQGDRQQLARAGGAGSSDVDSGRLVTLGVERVDAGLADLPATDVRDVPTAAEPAHSKPPSRTSRRKPRTSVPSWDDIMFGAKPDA